MGHPPRPDHYRQPGFLSIARRSRSRAQAGRGLQRSSREGSGSCRLRGEDDRHGSSAEREEYFGKGGTDWDVSILEQEKTMPESRKWITSEPNVLFGKPAIKGTR